MRKNPGWRAVITTAMSVGALFVTSAAPAFADGMSSSGSSTARSGNLTVTIWVAHTSAKAGADIPATITIDNHSSHTVLASGCPGTVDLMNLGNSKIPNSIIVPTPACLPKKLSPGSHTVHVKVWTFYEACTNSKGSSDLPRCLKAGKAPPLPAGTYRTNVVLPGINGLPTPKPLTIRLTA